MEPRNALWFAIGSVGSAFFSFLTLPILAWVFTQGDIGKIVLLQVVVTLGVVFLSLGLDQSYVREYHNSHDRAALAKTCIIPGFWFCILFLAIAAIFASYITHYLFEIDSVFLFVALSLSVLTLYLERFLSVFIRMDEKAKIYAITRIVPKLIFLVLIAVASLSSHFKNLEYLVTSLVLGWLASVFFMLFYLRRFLQELTAASYLKDRFSSIFAFGWPLAISGLIFWGFSYIDRLMLAKYSSFDELGLYSMAVSFSGIALLFQQFFATIWHPIVYKWIQEDVDIKKLYSVSEMVQAVAFFVLILSAVFSWVVLYLLPEEYSAVRFLIAACMIPPLLMMIVEVSSIGISIAKKTKLLMLITTISLCINLTLNYLLIPRFGAIGAAAATAISFTIYLIARTETAIYAWKTFPRCKMYSCAIFLSLLSISNAFLGSQYIVFFNYAWIVVLFIFAFCFRTKLIELVKLVAWRGAKC